MPEDSTIESFVEDIARRSKMDPKPPKPQLEPSCLSSSRKEIRRRWRNSSVLCQVVP
jgi:hypothetical protein